MSFDELIQQYRYRIASTSNKKAELEKIIQEINRLTYSQTGNLISREDKIRILKALRIEVVQESFSHFAQDNTEFLELIDTTIKVLGGK